MIGCYDIVKSKVTSSLTPCLSQQAKSTRGYTMLQVFVFDEGLIAVYPMERKKDFHDCLQVFCKEIGVPISLVGDLSGEQASKAIKRDRNQVHTTLRILEEHTQWANRAELYIGLLEFSFSTVGLLRPAFCFDSQVDP